MELAEQERDAVAVSAGAEQSTLQQLENVVERGLASFIETGRALREIHTRELYREAGFRTFKSYCEQRWQRNGHFCYALIRAVGVVENAAEELEGKALPSQAQAIVLGALDPDQQRQVCATVSFENETVDTIVDLVRKLRAAKPRIVTSRWDPLIEKLAALELGEWIEIPVPEDSTASKFRNVLRMMAQHHRSTIGFKFHTEAPERAKAIRVQKERPRAIEELKIIETTKRRQGIRIKERRIAELAAEEAPPAQDIPRAMCRRCGLIGMHDGFPACIDALRDRIAVLEIQLNKARNPDRIKFRSQSAA